MRRSRGALRVSVVVRAESRRDDIWSAAVVPTWINIALAADMGVDTYPLRQPGEQRLIIRVDPEYVKVWGS